MYGDVLRLDTVRPYLLALGRRYVLYLHLVLDLRRVLDLRPGPFPLRGPLRPFGLHHLADPSLRAGQRLLVVPGLPAALLVPLLASGWRSTRRLAALARTCPQLAMSLPSFDSPLWCRSTPNAATANDCTHQTWYLQRTLGAVRIRTVGKQLKVSKRFVSMLRMRIRK